MLYLRITKKQIRREVKHKIIEGINKDELVQLRFSNADKALLKWKHSKEFEYNGSMYDIVDSTILSDTTTYWCWWDNEETKLNKQLDESLSLIFGKDPRTKRTQDHLSHFLKTLYHNGASTHISAYAEELLAFYEKDPDLLTNYHSPPTPPPQA